MSKFVCDNRKCSEFGRFYEFLTNYYNMIDGKLVSENAPCPKCGCIRREINGGDEIPLSEKNISIGEYSSKSKEERTAMLKKRSHEHFEKKIKQKKNSMVADVVNKFHKD